jgi:hypothetical protein
MSSLDIALTPLQKLHDFWCDHVTSTDKTAFPKTRDPIDAAREIEWDCIFELRDAIQQITGKRPGPYNGSLDANGKPCAKPLFREGYVPW